MSTAEDVQARRTCPCGEVCDGPAALARHQRTCPVRRRELDDLAAAAAAHAGVPAYWSSRKR